MVYLDTSVVVPLFVAEPASNAVDAWFDAQEAPLMSSDWIATEFASALSIKVRRGALGAKLAQAAWKDFEDFCRSGLRLVPVGRSAFLLAADLARDAQSGLRAGDALHLAVALETGAVDFATADAQLAAGAETKGLNVTRF